MIPASTARIRFREYRLDDAAAVGEVFADPGARQLYPNMADPDGNTRWINWNLDNYATDGFGLWVIEHAENGSFLGDCGLDVSVGPGATPARDWLPPAGTASGVWVRHRGRSGVHHLRI